MGKFFNLGEVAAFAGSLLIWSSAFFLCIGVPALTAPSSVIWLPLLFGGGGLLLGLASLGWGLFTLQVHLKLHRAKLMDNGEKWLGVLAVVGGAFLAVISATGWAGLWEMPPAYLLFAVPGVPLGLFATGLGIHVLRPDAREDFGLYHYG